MKKTFELLWVTMVLLAFFSCKDEEEADDYINLSGSVLRFEKESGQQSLLLESSVPFDKLYANCNADWVALEEKADQGALLVNVTANSGSAVRSAILTLKAGNCIREIDILQEGQPFSLELKDENNKCWDTNTQLAFGINTDQKWTATAFGNWFRLSKTAGEGPYCMRVYFDRNKATAPRTGEVTVKVENGTVRTFTFTQSEALPEGLVEDSLALVAIYKHFDGETNWQEGYKWDFSRPLEDWYGVQVVNGRVRGLYLSEYYPCKKPDFPKELRNLSALEDFAITANVYAGELPYELLRASQLGMLALDGTPASGRLPVWIGNLGELYDLRASNTKLGGELPWELEAAEGLWRMELNYCAFTGELPACWCLPGVGNLLLVGNQLTGPVPESMSHFGENAGGIQALSFMDNPGMIGDIPEALCKRAGSVLKFSRTSLNCNN